MFLILEPECSFRSQQVKPELQRVLMCRMWQEKQLHPDVDFPPELMPAWSPPPTSLKPVSGVVTPSDDVCVCFYL